MTWLEVCLDKQLVDLPYKIELNRYGQIVMSPAKSSHSIYQGRILRLLNELMSGGEAFPECPLDTDEGTKSVDVVWASTEKLQRHFDSVSWPEAPEITVEILSLSNTAEEMAAKQRLYFGRGAREFWLCDEQGRMSFFTPAGQQPSSGLCAAFPAKV